VSIIIAIDLGSNSLGILKYDCVKKEPIDSCSFVVRTASSLVNRGIIDDGAISRIVDAINSAKDRLNFSNCRVKAVTTEAMRVAKNSKEAIAKIKDITDVEFEIISPKEEAELTFLAVKNRLDIMGINRDFIALDIGGGSTELTFYIDGKLSTKSFKIGIVTIVSEVKDVSQLEQIIEEKSAPIANFVKGFNCDNLEFIATAGTPTTVAALKHNLNYKSYDAKVVNGTKLTIDELNYYLDKLLNMSKSQREVAVGVGREDLIIAGILIYKQIYKILNKHISIVVDDSLREGVAISECKRLKI